MFSFRPFLSFSTPVPSLFHSLFPRRIKVASQIQPRDLGRVVSAPPQLEKKRCLQSPDTFAGLSIGYTKNAFSVYLRAHGNVSGGANVVLLLLNEIYKLKQM